MDVAVVNNYTKKTDDDDDVDDDDDGSWATRYEHKRDPGSL